MCARSMHTTQSFDIAVISNEQTRTHTHRQTDISHIRVYHTACYSRDSRRPYATATLHLQSCFFTLTEVRVNERNRFI